MARHIKLLQPLLPTQAQVVLDFEDGSLDAWEVVDEAPENLGDVGPSTWEIRDSQLGLDGRVLYQGSNIWGTPGDTMLMGTFIIYDGQRFSDFMLDVDVAAADNDAMGLVWAYEGTDRHYRVMMINDVWPDPPLDGFQGPMMIAHKRISNAEPWYELLEVVKDTYVPYTEGGERLHWSLEVIDGNFTLTREDGLSITGSDADYADGYVGIQLYAQQAEFDNFAVIPLDSTAVDAKGKLATAWGQMKTVR